MAVQTSRQKVFAFPATRRFFLRPIFCTAQMKLTASKSQNWRERVLCTQCEMNNRTRASIQLLVETFGARQHSAIYVAEQVTPLYKALKKRFPELVGSEYLGEKIAFGKLDDRGVRNESITKLTFKENTFDFILNFDVLEHVPEVSAGIHEIYRCLKPGGTLLLSVPFLPNSQTTSLRAKLGESGELVHLLPAQYHGDPIADAGCLCFQDFGWDLLDLLRTIGFVDVCMLLYWSDDLGYYGVEQMMIYAKKS